MDRLKSVTATESRFSDWHRPALQLLKETRYVIIGFLLLSLPVWVALGMLPTPAIRLLLIEPDLYLQKWLYHAFILVGGSSLVAAATLSPATRILFRRLRKNDERLSWRVVWLGILIPALIDFLLGASVILSIVAVNLSMLTSAMGSMSAGSSDAPVKMLFALFAATLALTLLISLVYPRLRWLATASMSGDSTFRERIRFAIMMPKPVQKAMLKVTLVEQVAAIILTILGSLAASPLLQKPAIEPGSDIFMSLLQTSEAISQHTGPLIAFLNGIGWLAIWLFLPYWVVSYEALPKPSAASRFSSGKTMESTDTNRP